MFLNIHEINKSFQRENEPPLNVLEDIDLNIAEGEFVSLLGPSGCGKSTLLSIIAGLTKATSGTIYLNGQEITEPGLDKSMVFQEAALFPWLSVKENVMFPLRKKMRKSERAKVAAHFLQMVHLNQFADHYPHELSGGMQQRVSIARAFAIDAPLLLMDEPFGALDEQTRNVLQEELEKIWLDTKKTIVFVTHSIREAIKLSDRVIVMGARPGTIISDIDVNLQRPRPQKEMANLEAEVMGLLKNEIDNVMKEELHYARSG